MYPTGHLQRRNYYNTAIIFFWYIYRKPGPLQYDTLKSRVDKPDSAKNQSQPGKSISRSDESVKDVAIVLMSAYYPYETVEIVISG